jgi:hypothetical protein
MKQAMLNFLLAQVGFVVLVVFVGKTIYEILTEARK